MISEYVNLAERETLSLEWKLARTSEICNGMKYLAEHKVSAIFKNSRKSKNFFNSMRSDRNCNYNSHFRVPRPLLYPLSYQVNGDWWRVHLTSLRLATNPR